MDAYGLEQDLKKLFILYGPLQVITGWKKVIGEFRDALLKYEPTTQATQTTFPPFPKVSAPSVPYVASSNIVFTDTITSTEGAVEEDGLYLPPFAHKVYTEKELYQNKLQIHKDKILEKRKELEAKGLNPDELLTEENLKRWVETDKMSYWMIAEQTGCSDSVVSTKAKFHNIFSDVALMLRKRKASIR